MEMDRWTLTVEFRSIQEEINLGFYKGGLGDAARLYAHIREYWEGMTEDDLDRDTDLTENTVTVTCPAIDNLYAPIAWLLMHTVPKRLELVLNDQ